MRAAAKRGHQRPQGGGEHHANPGERLSAAMASYFSSTQSVKRMKLGTRATSKSRGIMPARLRRAVASRAAEPRDVDVVLIMSADFRVEACARESRTLFSHAEAQARYGASVFMGPGRHGRRRCVARLSARLPDQTRREASWHIGGRMI